MYIFEVHSLGLKNVLASSCYRYIAMMMRMRIVYVTACDCNDDDDGDDDQDDDGDDGDDDQDDGDDDDDENCVDVKSVLTACDRPILLRATSYCDRSG